MLEVDYNNKGVNTLKQIWDDQANQCKESYTQHYST